MMRPPRRFSNVAGFDLNSGPVGIEVPDTVRRSRILGNQRRLAPVKTLPMDLQSESLAPEIRDLVGRFVGPGSRGGEDLPPLSENQLELVRYRYTQTVHQEAWSFRATKGRERDYYSGVDEGEADLRPAMRSTREWPSLGKLIWMLDRSWLGEGAGLYFGDFCWRVANDGLGLDEPRGSIEVSSLFYPAVGAWYDAAFEAWRRTTPLLVTLDSPIDSIDLLARAP